MTKILFLPGAGASPDFWKPVGTLLPDAWPKEYFGWPGLGDQPHDPAIKGIDDLCAWSQRRWTVRSIWWRSRWAASSPRASRSSGPNVRRLVLAVTSAGVNMAAWAPSDWRPNYRKSFPRARWITATRATALLPVERITAPTLLIWGDAEPISPIAVGRHLE